MERQGLNRRNAWYYIKNYKFRTLLVQNFMFVFIFATMPLVINMYGNYRNYEQEMNQRMEESNMELLLKSSVVMDNMISEVQKIFGELPQWEPCQGIYQRVNDGRQYQEDAKLLGERMREYMQSWPYVKSIFVYSSLNQAVIDMEGIHSIHSLEPINKWYDIYWAFPVKQQYTLAGEDGSLILCLPLYQEEGEKAGLLAVELDAGILGMRLENETVSEERDFFILDIGGEIMYWNREEQFQPAEKEAFQKAIMQVKPMQSSIIPGKTTNVISVAESSHCSWNYALVSGIPLYTEELTKMKNFLIGSVITGLLPGLLAAYLITFVTYRPVKKIINVIERPHEYLDNPEKSKSDNELLYITSNILNTIDKKEKMQEELEERIRSLKVAQLKALQFQVDPHFLYNTLEMIKWSSVEDMGAGNRTSELITKVSRLYREALNDDNMLLSLGEEIRFLQLYIDILDIRYDERILFEWDIDPSLYSRKVIKFCIQPLIENAIRHGLRSRRYYGIIQISAEEREDKLLIYVKNDGVEMSASEIDKMNQALSRRGALQNSGVGLRNINERIKLIYGMEYGLKIGLRGDGEPGMAVELTFPLV